MEDYIFLVFDTFIYWMEVNLRGEIKLEVWKMVQKME